MKYTYISLINKLWICVHIKDSAGNIYIYVIYVFYVMDFLFLYI
jgi:hypothetical protein